MTVVFVVLAEGNYDQIGAPIGVYTTRVAADECLAAYRAERQDKSAGFMAIMGVNANRLDDFEAAKNVDACS